MDNEFGPRCLVSHPAHPPHNLSSRPKKDPSSFQCFTCGDTYVCPGADLPDYRCNTCCVEIHHGCHEYPRRITHPYHLQHPLILFHRSPETGGTSNLIPNPYESFYGSPTSPPQNNSVFLDIIPPKSDIIFDICNWCGKDFRGDDWFYRCLICGFCLDFSCAKTLPPLTLTNPESHHHPLLFLPRPLSVPCDACGLVQPSEPSYTCFQCNYMAHRSCLDLPRVIKITRHPHRLSYVPYGLPVNSPCRICYKKVDIKYGQYTCNHEGCSYVAHSKCAAHANVWDGKELEWESEEKDDETQDLAPFRIVGDGLIQHFSHYHVLKLKKHDGDRDTEKQCQVCIFPIVTHQYYHCEDEGCSYSLHKECAGLSRKLDHALHKHTLTLNPPPFEMNRSQYTCSACLRSCTGFRYTCSKQGCLGIQLNVKCLSVPEYFTHRSHEHPIFLSTSHNSRDEILCKVCKERCGESHLQCTECEFTMCYTCGTIPTEIYYKFDKHLLTLSCTGSPADPDGVYWCEVCEKQLDPREWFYTCNKCCITVHLQCIFGSSYFMKLGSSFTQCYGKATVVRNSSNTRQFCYGCHQRCTGYVYYQGNFNGIQNKNQYVPSCSLNCLHKVMSRSH